MSREGWVYRQERQIVQSRLNWALPLVPGCIREIRVRTEQVCSNLDQPQVQPTALARDLARESGQGALAT